MPSLINIVKNSRCIGQLERSLGTDGGAMSPLSAVLINRISGSYPIGESSGTVEDPCRGWVCAKTAWVGVEAVRYPSRECHSYVLPHHCSLEMFVIVCCTVNSMNASHRTYHKSSWTSAWIWGHVSVDAHKPECGSYHSRFHREEAICCSALILHWRSVSCQCPFVKEIGLYLGLHRTCGTVIPKVDVVASRATFTSFERTFY